MDNIPAAVRSGHAPRSAARRCRLPRACATASASANSIRRRLRPLQQNLHPTSSASPEHRALSLKVAQRIDRPADQPRQFPAARPHANSRRSPSSARTPTSSPPAATAASANNPVTPLQGIKNRAGEAHRRSSTPKAATSCRRGRGAARRADPADRNRRSRRPRQKSRCRHRLRRHEPQHRSRRPRPHHASTCPAISSSSSKPSSPPIPEPSSSK